MADDKKSKLETSLTENITLNHDLSELNNLLSECLLCSSDNDKIGYLKRCTSIIEKCSEIKVTPPLVLLLEKISELAIVPPFVNREYFSYERSDFGNYSEITACVLIFLKTFFYNFSINYETSKKSSTEEKLHLLAKVSFKLVIVVGGNMNCPIWSSSECAKVSSQLMDTLMFIFKCETKCDFLNLKASYLGLAQDDENETLIQSVLSLCKDQLSSTNWQRNPFLSESFAWIISQITLPFLSNYLNQILATSLNFLDDFQEPNKKRGILCLNHLISNISKEELRWYNRAAVIYSSLKHQMYVKDASVLQTLFPCLLMILKVVDQTVDLHYHHDILDQLIRDTLSENLLILRRLYISFVISLVQQVGISCVRHLSQLLKIVEQFLEVEDGEEELARIRALQLLRCVILLAWPRISKHIQVILKAVLKLLVDINGKYYYEGKKTCAQCEMNELALDCLHLLTKVCPDTAVCLQHPDMAKGLRHVADILARLNIPVENIPPDI